MKMIIHYGRHGCHMDVYSHIVLNVITKVYEAKIPKITKM